MDLARCGEIGQSQDGLISRRQALQFLSKTEIESALRRKLLTRDNENVYAFVGAPFTWRRRLRAAVLARPDAIVSYLTAAFMWGLVDRPPKVPDLTVKAGQSVRTPGVKVHTTRNWHAAISRKHRGLDLTTPARTLIDISRCMSKDELLRAVDAGITKGIVTIDEIIVELNRIGSRGRSRCSLLFSVLALRDERFSKVANHSEAEWLATFRANNLPEPEIQHRIVLDATDTCYPDFAYPDRKVAIEIQSWRWHGGPTKYEADVLRKLKAQANGWKFVEVSWKSFRNIGMRAIRKALDDSG